MTKKPKESVFKISDKCLKMTEEDVFFLSFTVCTDSCWQYSHKTGTFRSFLMKDDPSASTVYCPAFSRRNGIVGSTSCPSFSHLTSGVGFPVTGQCFSKVSPSSNSGAEHCNSGPTNRRKHKNHLPFILQMKRHLRQE